MADPIRYKYKAPTLTHYRDRDNLATIDYVSARLMKQRKTWICAVVGEPGSGKSLFSLGLGCAIMNKTCGKPLDVERNVAYDTQDFIHKLRILKEEKAKGEGLVFEEAGVNLSAKQFQTKTNILFNFILQTFRKDNIFIIYNTPNISFFDAQARKLLNCVIEMPRVNSINFEKGYSIGKWMNVSVPSGRVSKDVYYIYPRYVHPEHGLCKLISVKVYKPPEHVCNAYEEHKNKFISKLDEDVEEELKIADGMKKAKKKLMKRIVERATTDTFQELTQDLTEL